VLVVVRIAKRTGNLLVAPHTPAVLRQDMPSPALHTPIGLAPDSVEHVLDGDVVLPAVIKVVLIGEPGPLASDTVEPVATLIFGRRAPLRTVVDPVGHAGDLELVKENSRLSPSRSAAPGGAARA